MYKKKPILASNIMRYLSKYLRFGSYIIQTNTFFEVRKKLHLLNFPFNSSKKELKTIKKLDDNTNQIRSSMKNSTISSIIIGILFIFIIMYFENLDETKQHKDVINAIDKILKNNRNYLIVPLLWLNDKANFRDVGLGCENESLDQGRSYEDKNINISHCFFSRYSLYDGNSGVIYVNGGSFSMNINYSMFYNCVCSNSGGAIYFDSIISCLRMICANSCSCGTSYYYHFAKLIASQMNQVEYLSVSNCSYTTTGYYTILIKFGIQRLDSTNSSMNNA